MLADGGGGVRQHRRCGRADHAPSNDGEEPGSIEGRVQAGSLAGCIARRPLAACYAAASEQDTFMWTVAIFSVDLGVCVAAAASSCSALWVKTVLKG